MRSLTALLSVLLLLPGALLAQSSDFVGYVPDRVVITVRAGVEIDPQKSADSVQLGIPALDRLADRFDVRNVEALHPIVAASADKSAAADVLKRVYAVDLPAGMDLHAVKAAYEQLPEVEEVRLVEIMRQSAYLPDDPSMASQWHVRNMNWGGGDVRAVGGWNQSLGDSNIVVAIIDSGMDWNHPDLGGPHPDRVTGAVWTNWTEYNGTAGVDDDGNGYMDDIRGWDFVHAPGSGWPDEDMSDADNDPSDYESHGTAVSGCVAAITNNGIGVAGVAPGCKLMALRAGYLPTGSSQGVVRMDWVSQAMIYAAAKGASIANLSAGSSSFLNNALNYCQSNDVLMVTAAGNDGTDDSSGSWLSTRPGVVSVAATDANDAKASFSNYGSWITVSAPGTAIYTTWYNVTLDESTYTSIQGTSFSSPITAGVAAMIRSVNPGLTYLQTITALTASCDNIDAENPLYAGQLGAGRVNMLKALGDNMHRFPDEFPTLFDALNESAPGDTVGVAAGTVITGPLTIPDGGIKFFGGYSGDYLSRDPEGAPAVIQGSLTNTVLRFLAGVDTDTEVDGFRIQGGGGLSFSGVPYSGDFGGGILVNGVSPTLRNLVVTGNSVGDGTTLGGGGGIFLNGSSAVLENVTVTGNTAVLGAGIYANNSTPTLIGCTLDANTLVLDNLGQKPLGGGLYAVDSDVTMIDCVVSNHTGCESGGGVHVTGYSGTSDLTMDGGTVSGNTADVKGGGVFFESGTLDMRGVRLEGNLKGTAVNFFAGGGLYAGAGTALVDSVVCTGNTAQLGAAITFENTTDATLTNSVIYGNEADFYGGGLAIQTVAAATVSGNTIADNLAPTAGAAGFYMTASTVGLDHNIIAFNSGGTTFGNGVHVASGTATFSCNDVFGHDVDFAGVADPTGTAGNISADPEFCNEVDNYNVTSTSPCDADNSGGCGLIGALADGCGIVSLVPGDGEDGDLPMAFRVDQNFPNPFNPITRIRFSLPREAHTEVAIFDIKGRRVRTIVSEPLPAQSHEVEWAGRDDSGRVVAAGVYFYMVSSGEHRSVGRMALVK